MHPRTKFNPALPTARILLLAFLSLSALAQTPTPNPPNSSTPLVSNAVTAPHFFAAHGQSALIDGYSSDGLEVWIYPFQILRGYRIAFLHPGATTPIDGQSIFSRIEYQPDSITRVYIGSDFVVREKLFIPQDKPGAVIGYSVASAQPLQILVHATSILNLMWPGALGGQSAEWNPSLDAFVLSEPLDGITTAIGSSEIVAHDEIVNQAAQSAEGARLGFTLQPDASGNADVFVALNPPHAPDLGAVLHDLMHTRPQMESTAATDLAAYQQDVLLVTTPNQEVNRAIASAEIALRQAWVCNDKLGCGFVAGYGPTRSGRRPQYDWFFAGDGLIAADGALSVGDRARAREELNFILRYQDKKSGMIWHELSQSAGFIDWAGKYPYMFVHVDVTFQFLETADRYVRITGDTAFARDHWNDLDAAYRYCRALIDPSTALPRIPAGKEGGNEQDRMSDDLGLSTSWVAAADAIADLATLTGHTDIADQASRAAQSARNAIPARYWDAQHAFWISGHNVAGQPMLERRSGPGDALTQHLFSEPQRDSVLDQLASAAFQTSWGTRSIAAGSPGYDPASYAKGSVWPIATADLAQAFWSAHRPVTALSLWSALVPLASLDSLGHMPEVLAGDVYHPQTESVPEQTWSSAGFLTATIHGLLGLRIDGTTHHLTFAPRLPATWSNLTIEHIRVARGTVSLALHRTLNQIDLRIQNDGDAFLFDFAPDLPLGANLLHSTLDSAPPAGTIENDPQETSARFTAQIPHGTSTLSLTTSSGVSVLPEPARPALGDPDTSIHIVDIGLRDRRFTIDADVPAGRASHLQLESSWSFTHPTGASLTQIAPNRVQLDFPADPENPSAFRRAHVTLDVSH